MPLILLSNDDGIDAPYLEPTAQALASACDARVVVVAPERERSAVSHSITLHKPLRLVERAPDRYAVSGSPVDCVYIAINKLLEHPPDVVVSGINRGYNLGADVFYSGTVGAAAAGALRKIPGIALSLAPRGSDGLAAATAFAGTLTRAVLDSPPPPRTVLNVNFPAAPGGTYQWTRLGERVYHDVVDDRHDPRGRRYYWIGGGVADADNPPGTDCHAVSSGHVSVTPLELDLTHRQLAATAPTWALTDYELVAS
ncbi:MAG TPA: 5'/3'-nucleotidase SurE [Kofleriaceae bacterium]|nr:5'/3'-nucleotidase SurE [Kofleriaceae bacterium]